MQEKRMERPATMDKDKLERGEKEGKKRLGSPSMP